MNLFEPLQPPGHLPVGAGHALAPGAMLEDFEVSQVLGLTSFGALYLANQAADGSPVAIKEYLPAAIATRNADDVIELSDPSHEEAFYRGLQSFIGEALALSQFNHPNLLHVSCVWEGNGTAYRAMPYLLGTSLLAKRSTSREPASQAQLQLLLDGLLGALETLNAAGLGHGQIEPVNVFMIEGDQPVLMDFDSVHHAVQSDILTPYVDAYSDPARAAQMLVGDLHAIAAVLHFAISGQWLPLNAKEPVRHEPLADVLTRLKDSASALGYVPEFLSAVDTALSASPSDRPRSVAEFRALFSPQAVKLPRPHKIKRPTPARAPTEYPLNSSESVLALLANFDRSPSAAEDVEPFESPAVPTLTEEAEPALPPMRTSLFDAMDAGDALPQDGVGYGRAASSKPSPIVPTNRGRQRALLVTSVLTLVLVCVGLVGWLLFG